jgi:hypothetical protein
VNTVCSCDKLSHGPTASAVGAIPSPTAHAKIAKSAKKLHPKSTIRDAAFIRSFRELAKSGSLGTAFLPLVCSMYMCLQTTPPCPNLMHHVCLLLISFFMLSRDGRVHLFDSLPGHHPTQDHAVVRTVR